MRKKYCHNSNGGEVFGYTVYANGDTTFPKGTLMVNDDYLTTGFNSNDEAMEWGKEWGKCETCKSSSKPMDGKCFRCGGEVVMSEPHYEGDY